MLPHAVAHNHVDCGRWRCVCVRRESGIAWHHIIIGCTCILDISKYLERKNCIQLQLLQVRDEKRCVWVRVHSAMHRTRMRCARARLFHAFSPRFLLFHLHTKRGFFDCMQLFEYFFFHVQWIAQEKKGVRECVHGSWKIKFTSIRYTAFQPFYSHFWRKLCA